MKRFFSLTILALCLVATGLTAIAQETDSAAVQDADSVVVQETETAIEAVQDQPAEAKEAGFTQELKKRFIEGGPGFMGIVLLCLILGLAIAIERIIFLNLSTTNTAKLTASVEDALNSGGVEAAKEVCRNTKGPVASIFYQGLDRSGEGVESAE